MSDHEVPDWDDSDPTLWAEPTDGERALEEWLAWHDPEYLEEIQAARRAGYAAPDIHRTLVPPWADPATAHLEEHFGWNGDHQWARTVRVDPRYL
jgi:hypothetical protein